MAQASFIRPKMKHPALIRTALFRTDCMSNDLVPDFQLTSSEGKLIRASDYRGISNLVLVFAHNPDDEYRDPVPRVRSTRVDGVVYTADETLGRLVR